MRTTCLRLLAIAFALTLGAVLTRGALAAPDEALWFVENVGQRAGDVAFYVPGASFSLEVGTDGGFEVQAFGGDLHAVGYAGAQGSPTLTGLDRQRDADVYYAEAPGSPTRGAGVFSAVQVEELIDGVDARYEGSPDRLWRRFTLAAGTDPAGLRLTYGDLDAEVAPAGQLILSQAGRTVLIEAKPVVYQDPGVGIQTAFEPQPDGSVALSPAAFDPARPLHIDLALTLSQVDMARESAQRAQDMQSEGPLLRTQLRDSESSAQITGSAALDGASGDVEFEGEQPDAPQAPDALIVGSDLGGGDLVPANGDVLSGSFTNVGTFHVAAGVTVFVDPGVPLSVTATEILIEGTIDADLAGFVGGATPPNPSDPGNPGGGPGGGEGGGFGNCVHSGGGGGGAYGGDGGDSSSLFGTNPPPALGGSAYGSPNPPGIMMGSGGGSGGNHCNATQGGPGGNGGGAVELHATRITVSGTITANGQDGIASTVAGGPGGGGGAGGGIWLDGCLTLDGATLSANGGDGGDGVQGVGLGMAGGGGGGGRIKLSGSVAAGPVANSSAAAGAAGTTNALVVQGGIEATAGGPGSIVDETIVLAGPCPLDVAPPSVGGFGAGAVTVVERAAAPGRASESEPQRLPLALIAVAMSLAAAVVGLARRRWSHDAR